MARDFIGELPAPGRRLAANLSSDELERGVRVRSAGVTLPAASGEVAERADPGGGLGTAAGWLGVAFIVALATVGARRLTHR